MNISHLNIGILHSLIGKNDGVSIVIDQSVEAMVKYMGIPLGNIFFLAAHSSPRFNAETNEIFWHKNPIHLRIVEDFCNPADDDLDMEIHEHAMRAADLIEDFIDRHNIDLLIAHNTSHPYNFITAVGLGYYQERRRKQGYIWPKIMVWWHDSYFERERFANPNPVIAKYLKYLPGKMIDGILFINKDQPVLAEKYYEKFGLPHEKFFENHTAVVPNTCDIPWNWKGRDWKNHHLIAPPQDDYNASFFHDIGLDKELEQRGFSLDDAAILLQHTRVVPRKKIETAIDFAFKLERRFHGKKCVVVLVSGHSGDEQVEYKTFLKDYHKQKSEEENNSNVILIFGENHILSHRDLIVDRKFYKFAEIPAVVAAVGGIGTYFSEIEGFGNNLLEMISGGLPTVINRYPVYKEDIEQLGFDIPGVENCEITDAVVEEAYRLLTDMHHRNKSLHHNMTVLAEKLNHNVLAEKFAPLIENVFFKK